MESIGSHLERLLPRADQDTRRRVASNATTAPFKRRHVVRAKGAQMPPFVILDGHVIMRRVAETGQVRAALIAGPGYLGGLRSISDPDGDAVYEVAAMTDGMWATWDPGFVRDLALRDAGFAVDLLDHSSEFALVLTMRLDERSFENARQRLASILTRYGSVIFDTPHPVAQRADLAAMIGAGRVMMYRALRALERDGLVEVEPGGGIVVLDKKRLSALIAVEAPDGAPAL